MLQVPQIKSDKDGETVSEDTVKLQSVEEYVGDLLSRIQPAPASEHRRKTVAQYVQDIIAKAFQPNCEARPRLHFQHVARLSPQGACWKRPKPSASPAARSKSGIPTGGPAGAQA